jgi:hypothetical protein
VIANEKRNRYCIARLAVPELLGLGLTIHSQPISVVPGHAVVPEMNINSYTINRVRWKEIFKRQAELASRNIIYRPAP